MRRTASGVLRGSPARFDSGRTWASSSQRERDRDHWSSGDQWRKEIFFQERYPNVPSENLEEGESSEAPWIVRMQIGIPEVDT